MLDSFWNLDQSFTETKMQAQHTSTCDLNEANQASKTSSVPVTRSLARSKYWTAVFRSSKYSAAYAKRKLAQAQAGYAL